MILLISTLQVGRITGMIHQCLGLFFFFWERPRLASNMPSSCLCLQSAGIAVVNHHTQLLPLLNIPPPPNRVRRALSLQVMGFWRNASNPVAGWVCLICDSVFCVVCKQGITHARQSSTTELHDQIWNSLFVKSIKLFCFVFICVFVLAVLGFEIRA
jgi:hypothetical protein